MLTQLKLERMQKNIKQWSLASIAGISQAELSNYELGHRRCPAGIRRKIAEALELPVEKLFPNEEAL